MCAINEVLPFSWLRRWWKRYLSKVCLSMLMTWYLVLERVSFRGVEKLSKTPEFVFSWRWKVIEGLKVCQFVMVKTYLRPEGVSFSHGKCCVKLEGVSFRDGEQLSKARRCVFSWNILRSITVSISQYLAKYVEWYSFLGKRNHRV